MRNLKRSWFIAKGLSALVLLSALTVDIHATTINFDDVADGTNISVTYAGLGVTFGNPLTDPSSGVFARRSGTNASPSNVVSIFATGVPAFDSRFGAVEATFSQGQRHVSIDAAILRLPEGLGTPTNRPRLEIYDMANAFVTAVQWDFSLTPQPPVGGITDFQTIEFTSLTDNIGKVRFMSGFPGSAPSNFGIFDNLIFTRGDGGGGEVSESQSMALVGLALLALCGVVRRKQHKANAALQGF